MKAANISPLQEALHCNRRVHVTVGVPTRQIWTADYLEQTTEQTQLVHLYFKHLDTVEAEPRFAKTAQLHHRRAHVVDLKRK